MVGSILSTALACQASQQDLKPLDVRTQEAAGLVQKAMTNPRMQAMIRQNVHPNATIVSVENLNAVTRERFLNTEEEAVPGFVVGDFNGDGVADYAALLRFPKKAGLGEWLVVFIGARGGGLQLRLLEKYGGFRDDVYITMEPPGHVNASGSLRIVNLRTPGIARIHPEKPPTIFYWEKGGFRRLSMSDSHPSASNTPLNH
jgi:hypothetical protein